MRSDRRGRGIVELVFVTALALACHSVQAQEMIYTTFGDFPNSRLLRVSSSMFSPDGTKAALPATQNGREFLSVNGQPGPLFDRLIRHTFAWIGGNRVVYFGERDGKEFSVVDAKETPLAGRIHRHAPVVAVSGDGSRFAYVEATQRQKRLVLDGKPRGWHSGVGYFQFGVQSKNYRYVIYDRLAVSAVINESKQAVFDGVSNLYVSDDGKIVGYIAELKDGSYPVVNGKMGRRIESIRDFVMSPDGRNLLISEYRLSALTGSLLVTLNGKSILPPLAENAILYDVRFSADSKRYGFAYPSNDLGDIAVRVDDKSIGFPGYISGSLQFSPRSAHYVFLGRDTQSSAATLHLNGILMSSHDSIQLGSIAFSSDETKLLYIAEEANGTQAVYVDGKLLGSAYKTIVSAKFLPDGNVAYLAKNDANEVLLIVGAKVVKVEFEAISERIDVGSGKIVVFGRNGTRLLRGELSLQ